MKSISIPINIEIYDSSAYEVAAALKIDKNSTDFIDFEESLDLIFQALGYQLRECHDSNRFKSVTKYYVYTKIENDVSLKALVSVRISDHFAKPKRAGDKIIPEYTLRNQHVAKQARQLAKDLGSNNPYLARSVNVVFNNTAYKTYDEGLEAIKTRLLDYEKMISK